MSGITIPFLAPSSTDVFTGAGRMTTKQARQFALAYLTGSRERDSAGDVVAHFVLEDETTGNGSLLCLDEGPRADAAIIIDGTRGERGINRHAGNLKLRIEAFGKPASVSVSHMGVNAAEIVARTCLDLKAATLQLNRSIVPPWSQFPSPNQISTIAVRCEETALTVPTSAAATLYATFTPPTTIATYVNMVREIANRVSQDAGADRRTQIHIEFAVEPVASQSSEIEEAIARAAGRTIPFGPSTGTSDMRHFVDRQIPCVLFGPGRGYNPHRINECFELNSLGEMIDLLTSVVRLWCR